MTPIAVLAILIVAGPALGGSAETAGTTSSESAVGRDSTGTQPEVILYYFHATQRCNTCRKIESYAQEAVEGKFKNELEAGRLSWTVLNMDEPDNTDLVKEFGLVSNSLVLVELDGGEVVRHQVLQEMWTLIRDKPRFIEYVQESVGEYLE
jgi:hypothetical protein